MTTDNQAITHAMSAFLGEATNERQNEENLSRIQGYSTSNFHRSCLGYLKEIHRHEMELKGEEEYTSTMIASSAYSPETVSFLTPERQLESPPSSGPSSPNGSVYYNDDMVVERPTFKTRWQEMAESYFSVVLKLEPVAFDASEPQHLARLARLRQALESGQRYYFSDEENKILLDIIWKFLTLQM